MAIVPEEIRNPPVITTSWNPKRLIITEERGAEDPWRNNCCLVQTMSKMSIAVDQSDKDTDIDSDFQNFIIKFIYVCTLIGFILSALLTTEGCDKHTNGDSPGDPIVVLSKLLH